MRSPIAVPLAFCLALGALPVRAQARDEARPRDLQRLQEDLKNLDDDLQALDPGVQRANALRARADEIREEVVYLKVKMRHHQRSAREGTGVLYDEVNDLRRMIADLRDDIEQAGERSSAREIRVREGTEVLVRLDEGLSSRTARREDRFEASVARPVRGEGGLALPAGTRLRGIVRAAEPAERPSKSGRLELDFDALYLDRTRLDLHSHVVAVHDEDDDHLDTREKAGIGAVLGGVLGGIIGGKKGAIAGVVIGAGGAVAATKGDDIDLPAGTLVTIQIERPIVVPRR